MSKRVTSRGSQRDEGVSIYKKKERKWERQNGHLAATLGLTSDYSGVAIS